MRKKKRKGIRLGYTSSFGFAYVDKNSMIRVFGLPEEEIYQLFSFSVDLTFLMKPLDLK
jgi:hypothetical protein